MKQPADSDDIGTKAYKLSLALIIGLHLSSVSIL